MATSCAGCTGLVENLDATYSVSRAGRDEIRCVLELLTLRDHWPDQPSRVRCAYQLRPMMVRAAYPTLLTDVGMQEHA